MGQRHADGLVVGGAQHGKCSWRSNDSNRAGRVALCRRARRYSSSRSEGPRVSEGGGEFYGVVLCLNLQTVPDAVRERRRRRVEHHGEHRVREGRVRHRRQDRGPERLLERLQGGGTEVKGQALREQVPGGCLVALRQGAGEWCGCGVNRYIGGRRGR